MGVEDAASSATDASSKSVNPVVCCMCGDVGLCEELFRCKICHVRLQHRYCSNLYPKLQSYIKCNWCLREGGSKSTTSAQETISTVKPKNRSSFSSASGSTGRSRDTAAGGGSLRSNKLHRNAFRLKVMIRKRSSLASRSELPSLIDVPRSGRKPAFRSRVRKFKLLEEVSR